MADQDPISPPAGGPAPAASAPVTDWESNDNPYKKKFIGMQGAYQKLDREKEGFQTKAFDLDVVYKTILGEKEALALEKVSLTEKHNTVAGELDVTKEALGRLNVIIAKYPDLLDFEKQGLLPDGVGEELETKLGAFKTALTARGAAAAQQQLQGATPPAPPAPAGQRTPNDIRAEAFKALREGKEGDYNKGMDDYWKAMAPAK
jgi:hypothetical protein